MTGAKTECCIQKRERKIHHQAGDHNCDQFRSLNLCRCAPQDVTDFEVLQQLASNQPADAVKTLEAIRSYEFGTGPRSLGCTPLFFRGLAYLKLHDAAKAGAEFQRILEHRGAAGWAIEYPLAQLNLGRAYAMQGDSAKARTAYQDFFTMWKDADRDVPVLKAAKAEYEKLK